jgi:UDP-N-acetylmuramoylalanine--D-glutamate ligase
MGRNKGRYALLDSRFNLGHNRYSLFKISVGNKYMWKKALIIGFGKSGKGALKFLKTKNIKTVVVDKNETLFEKIDDVTFYKETDNIDLTNVDIAILSPGVPFASPIVKQVLDKKIKIIGEIELGLKFSSNITIGITGSNGKTTTTLLVEFILNACGKSAKALGNVGKSFSEALINVKKEDILVLELSSYQLETLQSKSLDFATILNITPDHMDRYDSFLSYAKAKCKIFNCLKKNGKLFVNNNVYNQWFSKEKQIVVKQYPRLNHNAKIAKEDLIAAFAICNSLGISENDFFLNCEKFNLPPHRLEFVAEVNKICFYNDSKATNVEAVLNALEKVEPPVILIAGGLDKHLSFEKLNEACMGKVKCVFAIGQCANKIKNEIVTVPVKIVATLEEAVRMAYKEAKIKDNILLAPACASFDMFKNYEHRGDEFKRCVQTIATEERAK